MPEEKLQELNIDVFPGIVTDGDPFDLPKGMTNDCQDVYGDGTFVEKRPGITPNLTNTALGPIGNNIYDLIYNRLHAPGIAQPPSMLFALYHGVGAVTGVATYDPSSDDLRDLGVIATNHTDPVNSRLHPAQSFRMMITPSRTSGGTNWFFVEHFSGTAPHHRITSYVRFFSEQVYAGAWKRQHMWWLGRGPGAGNTTELLNRAHFSDFDDPTTLPAVNHVDVDPAGVHNTIRGVAESGDALYVGRLKDVLVLTGAVAETFRLEKTRIPFGFHGSRAWTPLKDGKIIGFTSSGSYGLAAWADTGNIGLMFGLDGEEIGESILTLIRGTGMNDVRVKDWPDLNGTLFITDVRASAGNPTPAIFRDKTSGAFWRWSIEAGARISSMDIGDSGRMYIGCADGHIRRFDINLAQDSGVNFVNGSYWATAPLVFGAPHLQWAIVYVRFYGTQTSGTDPTVAVATNLGAYGAERSFELSASGTRVRIDSPQGYVQQVRFTFAPNGVRQLVRKVVIGIKPTGRG